MPYEKSNIEKHPRFADIVHIYEQFRIAGKGSNYKELTAKIKRIAPEISYHSVYHYFRRFSDSAKQRKNVTRQYLRDLMKEVGADALEDLVKNPEKLSMQQRVQLAQKATSEELREIGMIMKEKHSKKEEEMFQSLLDQARYGGAIETNAVERLPEDPPANALPELVEPAPDAAEETS